DSGRVVALLPRAIDAIGVARVGGGIGGVVASGPLLRRLRRTGVRPGVRVVTGGPLCCRCLRVRVPPVGVVLGRTVVDGLRRVPLRGLRRAGVGCVGVGFVGAGCVGVGCVGFGSVGAGCLGAGCIGVGFVG